MIIKMIKSTSKTSIKGVTFMFGVAPSEPPPVDIPISYTPKAFYFLAFAVFFFVSNQTDFINILFSNSINSFYNGAVINIDAALDIDNPLISGLYLSSASLNLLSQRCREETDLCQ